MNVNKIEDRIGYYLVPHLDDFIFDELSYAYLERAGIADILTDVPIPIRKKAIKGLTTVDIARNMAFVIGCDPNFDYAENYIAYIQRVFNSDFVKALIAEGVEGAEKRDYDYACIHFRAAMMLDPGNADAIYCYGRACKDAYELGEEEDFVGRFKAEALDAFERVTILRPDFADGFYFLGYAYVNLGLYIKAKLTWDEYMKLTEAQAEDEQIKEIRKEVKMRLNSLEEPVEVENGYNLVLSGKFAEGIEKLTPYKEGQFKTWWPLWYYLGTAYGQLGEKELAVEHFRQVLQLSPSNLEAMEELVKLYDELGDQEKVEKYTKKMEVVKANMELDKKEAEAMMSASGAAPVAPGLLN